MKAIAAAEPLIEPSDAERRRHLPVAARKLLRTHLTPLVATVFDEATQRYVLNPDPASRATSFLGIGKAIAYKKADAYLTRVAPLTARLVYDPEKLLPKRTRTGGWAEIPCEQFGIKYLCRTDRIVWMLYPEIGWAS